MTSARKKAYFYLTLVALIWGIATPVIKFTLRGISPLPFLTYRFALSSIFAVLFIVFARSSFSKIRKNLPLVLAYSFITTTLALGILFFGLEKTTVIDAALIASVAPLMTALAGVIFLKEHITNQEKLGISIAFSGTLVTVFEPVLSGMGKVAIAGNFLVVAYIIIMAFASVLSKRLVRRDVDPLTLTNVSFMVGLITLLPFTLYQLPFGELITTIENLSVQYHAGVFYMALFSGTAAYALWVKGQKTIEISEAGVFAYLIPVFAAPLGVFWLGEKITPAFIVGAILITIGGVIAEYKKRRVKLSS